MKKRTIYVTMAMESDPNPEHLTEPLIGTNTETNGELSRAQFSDNEDIRESQQYVFLHMQQRKNKRQLHGSYAKTSSIFAISFILMTVIILIANSFVVNNSKKGILKIKTRYLLPFVLALTIALVIINTIALSLFKELLTWLFLYIPLIFFLINLSFDGDVTTTERDDMTHILYVVFGITEAIVLIFGIVEIFVIPATINSKWFEERPWLMEKLWFISYDESSWSVNYKNSWESCKQNICSYRGETDDKGMPNGRGFWLDDSDNGEMIKGNWVDGKPVAPFISTQNSGSTSKAILLMYILAGDDEMDEHKFNPTSEKPSRCGVASVECSVQGEFLRFLPAAESCFGPHVLGEGASISDCFDKLESPERFNRLTNINVSIDNDHGLQIANHKPNYHNPRNRISPRQVVINVRNEGFNERSIQDQDAENGSSSLVLSAREKKDNLFPDDENDDSSEEQKNVPYLQIENWSSVTHKDALIIFPGFNSSVNLSLKMWGQFLALTNLCNHVYPIVFGWPTGQVLNYWKASSNGAQSQEVKDKFIELLDGIHAAGIRRVHLISHSMGSQPLLSAFHNNSDDSPSEAANRFIPSVGFEDDADDEDRLSCETITLLNPDFPVDPFVDHAFVSIRRICSRITLVGDRNDTPLFFSHRMNALVHYFGKQFTPLLLPNPQKNEKISFATIGSHFDLLYENVKEELDQNSVVENDEISRGSTNLGNQKGKLYFKSQRSINDPARLSGGLKKKWLDIDVIDTTSLDTNIKGLRHSSFQMNPIMLNDLEDLIVSGYRASDRITLVHRTGNIFSYSHAPSFLAM